MDKQVVIETLASDAPATEQFNNLLEQLIAHPHHPAGVARFLNARGFTRENLQMLKYDIKNTYGISEADISAFVPEEVKPISKSKSKSKTAVEAIEVEAEEISNLYDGAAPEVKEGLKLRVEFPFLSEDDCPDKMKILVADKFTALEKYEAAHEQIQKMREAGETEGLFELGKKAVENWELNQLIYDELNYYQEHKELLGNHPIFADDMLQKTVEAYSTQEAMKRQGNLRSYISRDTKKLKGIKDAKKKANAEAKLQVWQDELDLIDARLNADDKK